MSEVANGRLSGALMAAPSTGPRGTESGTFDDPIRTFLKRSVSYLANVSTFTTAGALEDDDDALGAAPPPAVEVVQAMGAGGAPTPPGECSSEWKQRPVDPDLPKNARIAYVRGVLAGPTGAREWPVFTADDVAAHNTRSSCWVSAHGCVYDATLFLNRHPGSARAILKKAGQDCSDDFDFHGSSGRSVWHNWQIGVLDVAVDEPHSCAIM